MRKIILIGKNSSREEYWKSLRELGHEVLRFTGIKDALKLLKSSENNTSLIVIDRDEFKNPHQKNSTISPEIFRGSFYTIITRKESFNIYEIPLHIFSKCPNLKHSFRYQKICSI